MKYENIFHLISHVFEKEKIPCVLIGGFAVNYYKVSRQTADVDVLITEENYKKVLPGFKKEGYQVDCDEKVFARLTNSQYSLIDIDFLFVNPDTLEGIIRDGKKVKIAGKEFVVPSLNHLLALKLHSLKQNSAMREFKDLLDILQLVKMNDVNIHTKTFRTLCVAYGSKAIYQKISHLIDKTK